MKTLITAVMLAAVSATSVMAEPVFLPGVPTPITRVHEQVCTITSHEYVIYTYNKDGEQETIRTAMPIEDTNVAFRITSVNTTPTELEVVNAPIFEGNKYEDVDLLFWNSREWRVGVYDYDQLYWITLHLNETSNGHMSVGRVYKEMEIPSWNPLDPGKTRTGTHKEVEAWTWNDCTLTEIEE